MQYENNEQALAFANPLMASGDIKLGRLAALPGLEVSPLNAASSGWLQEVVAALAACGVAAVGAAGGYYGFGAEKIITDDVERSLIGAITTLGAALTAFYARYFFR